VTATEDEMLAAWRENAWRYLGYPVRGSSPKLNSRAYWKRRYEAMDRRRWRLMRAKPGTPEHFYQHERFG
jgi:hypothetical protein